MRYYINFDYSQAVFKLSQKINNENVTYKYRVSMINYGANIDALFNFLNTENFVFGALAELRLSGNNAINVNSSNTILVNEFDKTTLFDLCCNADLRILIAKHHSIEIYGRVPLFYKIASKNNTFSAFQKWNIGVRYTFNFNF